MSEEDGSAGGTDDSEVKMETAPFDPRFPNQNQTKHCYTSFLDYHRCVKIRGEDYGPCEYFLRVYKSLCPNAWISKWEEQMEGNNNGGCSCGKVLVGYPSPY